MTRRHIPFQALIIGLMSDVVLDSVIVSSCILVKDKSAVKEVESIENTLSMHL